MSEILSYEQLWTKLTNDPKTWPDVGQELFVLADNGDEDPFVVRVVMKGTLPHQAVFKLVNPDDDQDPILLQEYDVVAWRKV